MQVHGATRHGIDYFTNAGSLLRVETCKHVRIQHTETEVIRVGDQLDRYDGKQVGDILRKSERDIKGNDRGSSWELVLIEEDVLIEEAEDRESVTVNTDKVVEFQRGNPEHSIVLCGDLKDCPNYTGDEDGE